MILTETGMVNIEEIVIRLGEHNPPYHMISVDGTFIGIIRQENNKCYPELMDGFKLKSDGDWDSAFHSILNVYNIKFFPKQNQ